MKLIVAGSRSFRDYILLSETLYNYEKTNGVISEVVSGGAKGADRLAELWCKSYQPFTKPNKIFPADWGTWGKAAGPIRNGEMAKYADRAIVFWDGKSRGSKHMIDLMKELNKPVQIVLINAKISPILKKGDNWL